MLIEIGKHYYLGSDSDNNKRYAKVIAEVERQHADGCAFRFLAIECDKNGETPMNHHNEHVKKGWYTDDGIATCHNTGYFGYNLSELPKLHTITVDGKDHELNDEQYKLLQEALTKVVKGAKSLDIPF